MRFSAKNKFVMYFIAVIVCFLLCFLLTACNKSNDGVAAYVNDASIAEDTVTEYVHMQQKKLNLTDSTDWKNYLSQNKMTPKKYRDNVLDTLIDAEIIRQYSAEKNITVTDEEIDTQLATEASSFSTQEQYLESLAKEGQTLDQHKQQVYNDLLKSKATEVLVDEAPTPQDSITKMLFAYSSKLNGSKGYYQIILPADKAEQMQSLYNSISSGQISFEDACKKVTKEDKTGVNFDYVMYQCFIQNPSVCTDALNSMSVGQISSPIVADNYVYLFDVVDEIKCNDNILSLTQLPEYTQKNLEYYAKIMDKTNVYNSAFEELKNSYKIHKYNPPSNLDYF